MMRLIRLTLHMPGWDSVRNCGHFTEAKKTREQRFGGPAGPVVGP
jgi:hypothetical protein